MAFPYGSRLGTALSRMLNRAQESRLPPPKDQEDEEDDEEEDEEKEGEDEEKEEVDRQKAAARAEHSNRSRAKGEDEAEEEAEEDDDGPLPPFVCWADKAIHLGLGAYTNTHSPSRRVTGQPPCAL
jgi:hypothetical protein